MKKLAILLVFCCFATVLSAQEHLRSKLNALLDDPLFETSQLSLMVYDLTADHTLYQ